MRDSIRRLTQWCNRDRTAAAAWAMAALFISVATIAGPASREHRTHAEPCVRVRTLAGAGSIRIEGTGAVRARLDHHKSIVLGLPIEVSVGQGLHIQPGQGPAQIARTSAELESTTGMPLHLSGRAWSYRLCVTRAGASLDVIAEVPLERYVAGVLSGELFGDWPFECFRAQAIAARSYVVHQMMRSTHRAFDVEADDRDQVFLASSPMPKAVDAARRTRRLVLVDSRGEVLRTYFSSTCGGRAASARQIWPAAGSLAFNAAEPLHGPVRAHACDQAPLYRWRRQRRTSELSDRIAAWGDRVGHAAKTLGRLQAVRVIDTAPSGRPGTYELTDTRGQRVLIRADDLRVAMNFARSRPLLRTQLIPSNDFTVRIDGEQVIIDGRGFGHGVGLCQYCAAEWARAGYAAEQMLAAFYPGARLMRLSDDGPESSR